MSKIILLGLCLMFYVNIAYSKPLESSTNFKQQNEDMDTDVYECPWCFEGDMKLTAAQKAELSESDKNGSHLKRNKRKATSELSERWPQAIIPYVIDDELEQHTSAILTAIRAWEEVTCVRFHHTDEPSQVQLGHSAYLKFFKGYGCWSSVGKVMTSGPQEVSIGGGCQHVNLIIHEIGHALGFIHEHSRYDRDDYIEIIEQNVMDGQMRNFHKYQLHEIITEGVRYDTSSIMHYGPKYFSKNRQDTIRAQNVIDQWKLNHRDGLSFYDIKLANFIYNCNASCGELLSCQNDGYVGPDCNCVCKHGFSGTLCEVSEPANRGCAYQLTATNDVIMSQNYPSNYDNDQDCIILISGEVGSTILLTFEDFSIEHQDQCLYDYLEIRTSNIENEGEKFCGSSVPSSIESAGNEILLKFHSDASDTASGFKASYVIMNNLGHWSEWSDCQPSCQRTAKQRRERQCSGNSCMGPTFEERQCDLLSCFEDIIVAPSCGHELVEPRDYIASPGFPYDYDNGEDCNILIFGGEGTTILLTFEYMNLEDSSGCVYDFIEIRSNNINNEGTRYCGKELPPVTESVGSEMRLRFFTDGSVTSNGFLASYEIINHISNWTDWSQCSRLCGGGVQNRTRECSGQGISPGPCDVSLIEERPCNEEPCDSIPVRDPVGCDSLSLEWSDWSECSTTCSVGTRQRSRTCLSAENIETEPCDMGDCHVFSEWTPWSECVHHHGEYGRLRLRFCTGGEYLCSGSPIDTILCDVYQ